MSTRSIICRKAENLFQAIYCHWDGYPSHNGRILFEHYRDDEKVGELINLGSISILDSECVLSENQEHTFENRINGYTVAYHRDRGDDWEDTKPRNINPFQVD